jgi:Leucine-rich repeat (LRR) protein
VISKIVGQINHCNSFLIFEVPELPFHRLQRLHLAHNELASIPAEMASNLSSLHLLDLSHNDLTVVPLITHALPNLRIFNIAYNPITIITNTSFLGIADTLEQLDIRGLHLSTFEVKFTFVPLHVFINIPHSTSILTFQFSFFLFSHYHSTVASFDK